MTEGKVALVMEVISDIGFGQLIVLLFLTMSALSSAFHRVFTNFSIVDLRGRDESMRLS